MKSGITIDAPVRWIGVWLLWCSLSVACWCQFNHSRIVDERSGLPDNHVQVLRMDPYGFMWVGTQRGLSMFDGSHIHHFEYTPGDPKTPFNHTINDLALDSQTVWAGGAFGLTAVSLRDYSIRGIQFDCDGIVDSLRPYQSVTPGVTYMILQGDILWIGTRNCGLMKYDTGKDTFERFSFAHHRLPHMPSGAALDMIIGLAQDITADSMLWVGTVSGLIRFNHITGDQRFYFQDHANLSYQDAINTFRKVLPHSNGLIYYLTWGLGVNVFDPRTETFYPLSLQDPEYVSLTTYVSDMMEDANGQLWLRTKEGLHVYLPGAQSIVAFYPIEDPSAFYSGIFLEDNAGRKWIRSSKGIIVYDPLQEQLPVFSYKHLNNPEFAGFARKMIVHPDESTITIVGQSVDALYHFSHRTGKWFKTAIPGFANGDGTGFSGVDMSVHQQYGWAVSSFEGIHMFDPVQFNVQPLDLGISLSRVRFTDLEWDKAGRLWIGTRHEGILCYDPIRKHTQQYIPEIYGDQNPHTIRSASQLFVDNPGNIWFATSQGHSVYQTTQNKFHNFQLRGGKTIHDIARISEDHKGTVWVVSHTGVVAKGSSDHPELGLEVLYSIFEKGITPSYVEGMVYGADRMMYILCESALVMIDSTNAVSSFSFDYAPYIKDFYSFDKFTGSTLVVGMRNKFALLQPEGLRRNPELPIPYLTGITINEKPLSGNFLQAPPPMRLRYDQNYIAFSFSAISYSLSELNRFQYRLSGIENDWVDAGSRRYVGYTNIPSGGYTFELRVANNEGIWNPDTWRMEIHIARPWWATWWFRALLITSIVSVGVAAYRFRINQVRKEANLKSEFEKKIGDIELSALRAQMNPHFIFNCLNSIENYILKNESIKAAEYINDFARLIRLILQNSRSQQIPLTDEVEALDLYLQMESLRFDNRFEYRIQIDENIEQSEIDIPPMLIQPFVENAIWHGLIPKNAPGRLDITVSRQNGILHCVIEDNGIGREKSKEINASMHKRGKKSMGMLITQNRLEVLNELYHTHATVTIRDLYDAQGKASGTRVELNIPVE